MLINYDLQVITRARIIANRPGATQRDLAAFVHDVRHITWSHTNLPYVSPEIYQEIVQLQRSLPRRRSSCHSNLDPDDE